VWLEVIGKFKWKLTMGVNLVSVVSPVFKKKFNEENVDLPIIIVKFA
jgi:hypothetical protein